MINPNMPLELDDGRQVRLSSSWEDGVHVYVDGDVMRPNYTFNDAENDGLEDEYDEYENQTGEGLWSYGLDGIFVGGNAHGFFVLRNRYEPIPDVFEEFFVA